MDFSNIPSATPTQVVKLTAEDYKEDGNSHVSARIVLFYVKFQKVINLSLFVEDNIGGSDTTVLTSLIPWGKSNKTITKVEQVIE